MVPLAIGSQTNGSVIRPASYCGVFAFKPSHGLISRLACSPSHGRSTTGVFARTLEDRPDRRAADRVRCPRPRHPARDLPRLLEVARQDWLLAPDLALVKSPVWDQAEEDLKAAFAELAEALGLRITSICRRRSARTPSTG